MSRSVQTFMIVAMMTVAGSALAIPAVAADAGFGVRFSNRAPAALEDTTTQSVDVAVEGDVSADQLNQITPAAGDVVPPSYEPIEGDTPDDKTPAQNAPADPIQTDVLE